MTPALDLRDGLISGRLEEIGRVLLFASGKGGVGKSTLSASTAYLLSSRGRVGVLDLDLHGPSIPALFGIASSSFRESREGLVPAKVDTIHVMSIDSFVRGRGLPARGARKAETMKEMMAITNFGPLDTLVVDLPPGTGDEFLTALEMFRGKEEIVFVTQPSMLSWNVTKRALGIAVAMKSGIAGVIQNMGRPLRQIEKDCSKMGVPVLGSIGYHGSISDRPVSRLRGSAFMRELKNVLEAASLL